MTQLAPPSATPSLHKQYATVSALLAVLVVVLVAVTREPPVPAQGQALLEPVFALVGLTVIVWFLMVGFRNVAVIRGLASVRYYRGYKASEAPAEIIERPARAFNNLLEVPTLFYAVCSLMIASGTYDSTQVTLAWIFVAVRAIHASVHIGVNSVPYRFAAFAGRCITLGVLWVRFARHAL